MSNESPFVSSGEQGPTCTWRSCLSAISCSSGSWGVGVVVYHHHIAHRLTKGSGSDCEIDRQIASEIS